MNRLIAPALRSSSVRGGNRLAIQNFTSVRWLATTPPPPRRRPRTPPKEQSLTDRFGAIKQKWAKLNESSKFRAGFSATVILLYVCTAYAGVQYLMDTKYKATGDPNPYKKREDAEKERLENTSIDEIKANSTGDVASEATRQENPHIPAPRDTTDIFEQMAREYDDKIWFEELTSHIWYRRRQLMKCVSGDVLEVSCGTGRNISYFNPDNITSVTFMDSSKSMLEVAREKFTKKFPTYERVQYAKGKAEDLAEMASSSGQKFDTIYETFGLCSHGDPLAALKNFKALLRKDGRIVLLEHGRSFYDSMNDVMDKKAEKRAEEWGCRWNLDIDQIVKDSGLEVLECNRYHFGSTYFYILKNPGDN